MKRPALQLIASVLLLTAISVTSRTNDTFAAQDSLKYLGHASVKIKTAEGKVIYIDPYAGTDYADSADIVLVTHQHSDHNQIKLVKRKKTCTIIQNTQAVINKVLQTFNISDIKIEAVYAYNPPNTSGYGYHGKDESVGYILEINGIKIYHAGDTGLIPEMNGLASRGISYALLPTLDPYTMTPEDATQAAINIKANFNIPIHTAFPPALYDDATAARFKAPNKLVIKPGQTIPLQSVTAVQENHDIRMNSFELCQNYPNPFNPSTQIKYSIPHGSHVSLKLYDILGNEICTLVNEEKAAGSHSVVFNAGNLSSGFYFYKIEAGNSYSIKKLLLLK